MFVPLKEGIAGFLVDDLGVVRFQPGNGSGALLRDRAMLIRDRKGFLFR